MNKWTWMIGVSTALLALHACGPEESQPEGNSNPCGAGESIETEAAEYCVFQQAVVVENGFECPAERPHLTEAGVVGVCGEERTIPAEELEEIAEQYREENPDTPGCIVDGECEEGGVCQAGECVDPDVTTCQTDEDCGFGSGCQDGECRALPAGCGTDADCMAGDVCIEGMCTSAPECEGDVDCAPGQTCVDGACVI